MRFNENKRKKYEDKKIYDHIEKRLKKKSSWILEFMYSVVLAVPKVNIMLI
jgi:hypothetical protein